jgi:hypothetical protein
MRWSTFYKKGAIKAGLGLSAAGLILLLVAVSVPDQQSSNLGSPASQSAAPVSESVPLILLRTEPETGYVGDTFTISGEELPAETELEFVWLTWEGAYVTNAGPENVEFQGRSFQELRMSLGTAFTDTEGNITASFTVPEDYGEIHDIYAVLNGEDIAKGGFRILRHASISPTEGPVGTPITITITGIGMRGFENTMGVLWDNRYTGFMTAITTNGTATAQIRAAGPVGPRVIALKGASAAVPYLNVQQSPVAHIALDWSWVFTVTENSELPPNSIEWPDDNRVARYSDAIPITTTTDVVAVSDLTAALEPDSGPIHSETVLRAGGLPANTTVELFWISARGNRLSPSGWSLTEISLLESTAAEDGSLNVAFQIPDDLGGWHALKMVADDQILAEVPFYVERSLVEVTPQRVRVGETFTVNIKGIGWTELDNGVAVTYNNAFIGYACGFNSNGDVTLNLVATGEPGIHLIDLYPMIYQGKAGDPLWNYGVPFLTFAQDFPGLSLGYRLPAFRLAIEVVE